MSQENENGKATKCAAAESVESALSKQRIAEKINADGQQQQFAEVYREILNNKEWLQQAQGAANILKEEVRATETLVLVRHMATFYKVGFEAGRSYERSLAAEKVEAIH